MMKQDKGFQRESTLSKEVYFSEDYFDKYQLFSLSEQINLLYQYVKTINEPKILEVGKRNGFISDFFKKAKFDFKTFNINENLEPDIVGNILELNSLIDLKPDVILCSKVLEHIEFQLFEKIIKKYFMIVEKGSFHTNPYHNFYVLKKV